MGCEASARAYTRSYAHIHTSCLIPQTCTCITHGPESISVSSIAVIRVWWQYISQWDNRPCVYLFYVPCPLSCSFRRVFIRSCLSPFTASVRSQTLLFTSAFTYSHVILFALPCTHTFNVMVDLPEVYNFTFNRTGILLQSDVMDTNYANLAKRSTMRNVSQTPFLFNHVSYPNE